MYKNVASQKIACYAWDGAAGAAKTGDAANISAQISIDGGACAATNDLNPTELDAVDAPGIYIFDLLQAETNADMVVIAPVSSTADITIRPIISYTIPPTAADIAAIRAITDVIPNAGALTDIDTGINNLETTCITNAAGDNIAADIIALKAETVEILEDTGTTIPALMTTVSGLVVSATDRQQFIVDTGHSGNDCYDGMIITLTDVTDGHKETRRIVNYIGGTKEIFVDRNFSFTPVADDPFLIHSASYGDVNITHVNTTAQTAGNIINRIAFNKASIDVIVSDVDTIKADTNELQVDLTDGGRLDTIFDAILLDTGTTLNKKLKQILGLLLTR